MTHKLREVSFLQERGDGSKIVIAKFIYIFKAVQKFLSLRYQNFKKKTWMKH